MVMKRLEETFGLPPLSEIGKTIERFPDQKQLKAIKEVLTIAERVAEKAPELDQVVLLVKEINSMPTDKLKDLEKILKRIERIIKTAPQDLMEFIASLKGE